MKLRDKIIIFIGNLFLHEERKGELLIDVMVSEWEVQSVDFAGFTILGSDDFVDSVKEVLIVFQQDFPFMFSNCKRYSLVVMGKIKSVDSFPRTPKFLVVEEKIWLDYRLSTRVYLIILKVMQLRFLKHNIPPLWNNLRRIEQVSEKYVCKLSEKQAMR